ncbi:hypothetical protein TNCT_146761 [Trichonephila clavata]|uniref:Major facilitator superfamily associated domain-containing protein n=1 Tax=Trichonephila clavata TaxID=2740835 RepID=A0A8X6HLT0_TRICU|nr:hypothetical protein TNCT_146761 [Trichonephila clavata]
MSPASNKIERQPETFYFDENGSSVKNAEKKISLYKGSKVTINKVFLPVKMALFCWFSGGKIYTAFLPVFLKSKGFTIAHLSILTAISVAFQLLGTVLSGIITDKIGRAKPVLNIYFAIFLLSSVCLVIMPNVNECNEETLNLQCYNEEIPHFTTASSCQTFKNNSEIFSCSITDLRNASLNDDQMNCTYFTELTNLEVNINKNTLRNVEDMCHYKVNFKNYSAITSCVAKDCASLEMKCVNNNFSRCNTNVGLWMIIYGILISILNLSHTAIYRLFDVVVVDLVTEHNNDFGRQRVWSILGSFCGPPLAGYILHQFAFSGNQKIYFLAFVCSIIFSISSVASICFVDTPTNKPAKKMWKKSLQFVRKLEVFLFIVLLLVAGSSYGFQAVYVSWYLQEIGASDLIIGVSRGMNGLYGLPFLYSSKWWISRVGERKIFVLALLGHAIFCFSFSLMLEPWFSVVIEATSILNYHLFWVAVMQYVTKIAPDGLQATLKVMAGSLHFNIGRLISTLYLSWLSTTLHETSKERSRHLVKVAVLP